MRSSTKHGIVITLLNAVIVALAAVIMFVPRGGAQAYEPPQEDEPASAQPADEHSKVRAPVKGAADGIERETRLMGLGDERAVAAFDTGAGTIIFGNATVAGLDFDAYGAFIAVLGGSGETVSITSVPGRLGAACAFGAEYVMAAGESLYTVDRTGAYTVRAELTAPAVDVFAAGGSTVAAVLSPSAETLEYTEFNTSGSAWSVGRRTRLQSGYTLGYIDTYLFSDTAVMAVRAHSLPRYDALTLYEFRPGGDPTPHIYGGAESVTRPYAVLPYGGGYMAAVSRGGVASMLYIDYAFTTETYVSLGFTFADAGLYYCLGEYYASFWKTSGPVTYRVGGKAPERMGERDGEVLIYAAGANGSTALFFAAAREGAPPSERRTRTLSIGERSFDIADAEVHAVLPRGGALDVVISAAGGSALSPPTGRDVYIIRITP